MRERAPLDALTVDEDAVETAVVEYAYAIGCRARSARGDATRSGRRSGRRPRDSARSASTRASAGPRRSPRRPGKQRYSPGSTSSAPGSASHGGTARSEATMLCSVLSAGSSSGSSVSAPQLSQRRRAPGSESVTSAPHCSQRYGPVSLRAPVRSSVTHCLLRREKEHHRDTLRCGALSVPGSPLRERGGDTRSGANRLGDGPRTFRRGRRADARRGAHARCHDCGRTPLIGEYVYLYETAELVCELCRHAASRSTDARRPGQPPPRRGHGSRSRGRRARDSPFAGHRLSDLHPAGRAASINWRPRGSRQRFDHRRPPARGGLRLPRRHREPRRVHRPLPGATFASPARTRSAGAQARASASTRRSSASAG